MLPGEFSLDQPRADGEVGAVFGRVMHLQGKDVLRLAGF